jgi:REP element-mobilizing transposase RayT
MYNYNSNIHHRRSIRLKGYDYSQAGFYFITSCCQHRACLFGEIIEDSVIILNDAGKMIEAEWLKLPQRFNNIKLHEYVVMPNHFHAILEITAAVGAILVVAQNEMGIQNENAVGVSLVDTLCVNPSIPENQTPLVSIQTGMGIQDQIGQPQGLPQQKKIGDIMDAFKSITTVEYIRGVNTKHWLAFNGRFWQRNYYEHIIRNESSYQYIVQYIIHNPSKWLEDKFYQP